MAQAVLGAALSNTVKALSIIENIVGGLRDIMHEESEKAL
jgi:hypothetical protein